jgi:hypothetical protein
MPALQVKAPELRGSQDDDAAAGSKRAQVLQVSGHEDACPGVHGTLQDPVVGVMNLHDRHPGCRRYQTGVRNNSVHEPVDRMSGKIESALQDPGEFG